MLQSSLSNLPPSSSLALEARESLCPHRMWLQFMRSMTEEGERDLDIFSLSPVTVPKRFWRAQEDSKDSKSHSQAHDVFITSQTRPVIIQVVVQAQSTRSRSV